MSIITKAIKWITPTPAHEVIIEKFVSMKISKYGRIHKLDFDLAKKSLLLHLHLNGDTHPVQIHVTKYETFADHTGNRVRLIHAFSDRQWLNHVLQDFLIGKDFSIPDEVADIL